MLVVPGACGDFVTDYIAWIGLGVVVIIDALHLAAAQLSGCDELWTNDARLTAAARGLAVDVLA